MNIRYHVIDAFSNKVLGGNPAGAWNSRREAGGPRWKGKRAPGVGIPEDPVTGSAHCTLIPYWSERLAKKKLHALQLSERGGELFCEDKGERVSIGGRAALYLSGAIRTGEKS